MDTYSQWSSPPEPRFIIYRLLSSGRVSTVTRGRLGKTPKDALERYARHYGRDLVQDGNYFLVVRQDCNADVDAEVFFRWEAPQRPSPHAVPLTVASLPF